MASGIKCDHCGEFVPEMSRSIHLEHRGPITPSTQTELDFCGYECLGDWSIQFLPVGECDEVACSNCGNKGDTVNQDLCGDCLNALPRVRKKKAAKTFEYVCGRCGVGVNEIDEFGRCPPCANFIAKGGRV